MRRSDIVLRAFRNEDTEELLRIFTANTPEFFDTGEKDDFHSYLQEHGEQYLVVELQGRLVGGAGWYVNGTDKSGRITWIFFEPDSSGKGLGRAAVEHCLEILRNEDGVEKYVVTTSQKAYGFFQKFGFEIVRTEKDHWGPGLDLYLMEKPLDKR